MSRTPEQLKAIGHDGGNIVVSASAGSGKTSVMIERFVRLVLDKKATVREILAVTFTKLAAEEMKSRLYSALKDRIAEGKDAEYIKSQLDEISLANVSTVHSFCTNVIRRYYYLAEVDPSFSIADESISDQLKTRAINETFTDLYEEKNEDFFTLVRTFLSRRNDGALRSLVLSVYKFASAAAYPEKFYDSACSAYSEEGLKNAENGLIAAYIEELDTLFGEFASIKKRCGESGETKYDDYISALVDSFERFKKAGAAGAETFVSEKYKKPRKDSKKDGEFLLAVSDEIGAITKKISDVKDKISEIFAMPDNERLNEELKTGELLKKLVWLVRRFSSAYDALKRERNVLDFSDLEHFTLKILEDAEAREEIASSFKYIFVDEYQDTNDAQETIFLKIARDNLFIVGDVKQCIYAFRGSKPDIFTKKIEGATKEEFVDLGCNFRSAKAVVDAVNNVFSRVMKKDTAGVSYADNPMKYGGLYPEEAGEAEIRYIEREDTAVTAIDGVYSVKKHLGLRSERVASARAREIVKIVEDNVGKEYHDRSGAKKTLGYKDFTIVTRNNDYEDIAEELARVGISVSGEKENAITDYSEIALAVDILTTIRTRAKDDAALFSCLKSGMCGLDDKTICEIVGKYRDVDFHEAVRCYSENESDSVAKKLAEFYEYINKLTVLSAVEGCATLLRRVIIDKRLDLSLLSGKRGKIKVKRLERFLSGLSAGGTEYSLGEFVSNKECILKNIKVSDGAGEDSVRIMSIHKSKGLEAPVVILAGIDKKFFKRSASEPIYMHSVYGLGINRGDVGTKTKYASVIRKFIGLNKKREQRLEEMRLLYVAMTRAEVKLFIVTEEPIAKAVGFSEVESIRDFLSTDDMPVVTVKESELTVDKALAERPPVLDKIDEKLKKEIEKNLSFVYPHEDEKRLSLKRTVTEVSRSAHEEESEPRVLPIFGDTDIEHGVAYHKFLQYSALDPEGVDDDIARLIGDGVMTEKETEELDKEKLRRILSSGALVKLDGYTLYREKPFIVGIPPELAGEKGESPILLQGVIDLLAVKGEQAVIVDYKYSSAGAETLRTRYGKQLDLYSFAVEKITGKKVCAAYIFNINTGEAVDCLEAI